MKVSAGSSHVVALVALLVAALFGAISSFVLVPRRAAAEGARSPAIEDPSSRTILERLDALAESIARLEARLDALAQLSTRTQTEIAATQGSVSSSTVAPKSTTEASASKRSDGWTSVLDEDVARTLVEHGLTPFDERVVPLVLSASASLRAAQEEFDAPFGRAFADFKARSIDGEQFADLQESLGKERAAKRKLAIDDLRTRLDALGR